MQALGCLEWIHPNAFQAGLDYSAVTSTYFWDILPKSSLPILRFNVNLTTPFRRLPSRPRTLLGKREERVYMMPADSDALAVFYGFSIRNGAGNLSHHGGGGIDE